MGRRNETPSPSFSRGQLQDNGLLLQSLQGQPWGSSAHSMPRGRVVSRPICGGSRGWRYYNPCNGGGSGPADTTPLGGGSGPRMSFWSSDLQLSTSGGGIHLPTYKVSSGGMDTESLRSGHSEQSSRSRSRHIHMGRTPQHHVANHHQQQQQQQQYGHNQQSRNNNRNHGSSSGGVGGRQHRSSHHRSCPGTPLHKMDEEGVIEVQILPQDDNWGDNTTCITGNTSDRSGSVEDFRGGGGGGGGRSGGGSEVPSEGLLSCHMWLGSAVAFLLSLCAFLSPVVMVALPKLDFLRWKVQRCGPECDGLLISFAFKLLILLVGSWAVFWRRPKATMPRILLLRAVVLALVLVFTFSYWLFYGVRILERRETEEVSYHSIVLFAVSLVDALLFIHYLAVLLLEVRHLQPQYTLKVVRSPDGVGRCYNMGQLSIQRAAVWVLEHYYQDFPIYNPYLETLPRTKGGGSCAGKSFKFYDLDTGSSAVASQTGSLSGRSQNLRRRDSSHNERFYEEHEYERRVRKRRARLVTAAEEAFTHLKRLRDEPGAAIPMEPGEAAQAIFPSMARALQKYLRITRQQPRHTMQGILEHLAMCLSHDLSPKAFLEKYLVSEPVLQNDQERHRPVQTWALVCDTLLSRPVTRGTVFMLRQNDVSLMVTVAKLPHFNITEEVIDPKSNKFVLRLNSETSV